MLVMQYRTGSGSLLTSFTQSMINDNPNTMWIGNDAGGQLTDIYNVTNLTSLPAGFEFQAGTGPTGHQTFKLNGVSDVSNTLDTTYAKWFLNFGTEFLVKFDSAPTNNTCFLMSKNSYYATSFTDFPFCIRLDHGAGSISANFSIGDDYNYDYTVTLGNFSPLGWNHVAVMYDENNMLITLVCNGQVATTNITSTVPNKEARNFFIGGPALGYAAGADTAFANHARFSHLAFYHDFGPQPTANVLARYAMLP